jgi:ABC-type phosphate/phosphonate transport system permease subunit
LKSVAGAIFSMKSAIVGAVGVGGIGLLVQRSFASYRRAI